MTNQIAAQKETNTIAQLIQSQMPAIAMVINGRTEDERQKNAQRLARIALTEVRKNPKLADCSQASFASSLMQIAQLNLEPGPLGEAYLIPYKNECTFQIGYQGLIALSYRSGKVKTVYAEVVYRKEVELGLFHFEMGLKRDLIHNIDVLDDSREGDLVAVYAVAELEGGAKSFVVLTQKDIDRTKKSSQSATSNYSPWNTAPEEMWKKTAIKRLSKYIPKSIEMAHVIQLDEQAERGEVQIFDADSLPIPTTPSEKLIGALDKKLEAKKVIPAQKSAPVTDPAPQAAETVPQATPAAPAPESTPPMFDADKNTWSTPEMFEGYKLTCPDNGKKVDDAECVKCPKRAGCPEWQK